MEKVIKGTCIANDATYTFEYKRGYPAVVNHVEETEFIAGVASGIPGVENVHEGRPTMGGEDFAYYLERVKGCFIHTGAALETRDTSYSHHHPKFDIDEKGLLIAAKVLGQATVQYLEQHKNAGQTNDTTLVKIKGV